MEPLLLRFDGFKQRTGTRHPPRLATCPCRWPARACLDPGLARAWQAPVPARGNRYEEKSLRAVATGVPPALEKAAAPWRLVRPHPVNRMRRKNVEMARENFRRELRELSLAGSTPRVPWVRADSPRSLPRMSFDEGSPSQQATNLDGRRRLKHRQREREEDGARLRPHAGSGKVRLVQSIVRVRSLI